MYKQIFTIFVYLWGVCLLNINAQAIIQIPFKQAPLLEVSGESFILGLPDNGTLEIGAELVITGGSGDYTYLWTSDNQMLGTEPTLIVSEYGDYFLAITDGNDCSKSVKFTVGNPAGISALKDNIIAVYPNPTHGDVYLESLICDQITQISVVSLEGKLLRLYNQIPKCENNTIRIDLSDLPQGTYMVSYVIGKEIITKQIILL